MLVPLLQDPSRGLRAILILLCLAMVLVGCRSKQPPSSYVARVGSHYLTQDELSRMLDDMGPIPDSAEARQQAIDQWVTNTLLYREALRRDLASVEEIKQKLKRQRRSLLITAITNRIQEKATPSLSREDVRTYFEQHKDQMRLREPYVNVRYLATSSSAAAETVRQKLRSNTARPDSLWTRLVRTHAVDSSRAVQISRGFRPQRRLAQQLPYSRDALSALDEGERAAIVQKDQRYHVLQLVRRFSEGAEPKLSWFADRIRQRLRIRARKQMYTREVQRLRSEARADGVLELPRSQSR